MALRKTQRRERGEKGIVVEVGLDMYVIKDYKLNKKNIRMMCKIVRDKKLMCSIFKESTKRKKSKKNFGFTNSTSRKPVRCTGKLLKIKSKLILIILLIFLSFCSSKCCRQDR